MTDLAERAHGWGVGCSVLGARLLDSLEAIERVETYAVRGRRAFEKDELIQTCIVHHLQIIGEAARKLTEPLRAKHPEVPWAPIIAMRNMLVHDYFRVDEDEVWAAVERDLSDLKTKVQAILQGARDPT